MQSKFEKIKQKYITSFAQKQNDLEKAWGKKDISLLHSLLHKLAGSSGSYGFKELSDLCQEAMKYTRDDFNNDMSGELETVLNKIFNRLS